MDVATDEAAGSYHGRWWTKGGDTKINRLVTEMGGASGDAAEAATEETLCVTAEAVTEEAK